jgi:hypothetical protein
MDLVIGQQALPRRPYVLAVQPCGTVPIYAPICCIRPWAFTTPTHDFSKQPTMPGLEGISYSRDATVAAFRDYYSFLVSMYLDTSAVQEPPKGGWPTIPQNGWPGFDKTDEVVALLRELPYLKGWDVHAAPYTVIAEWYIMDEDADGEGLKEWTEPDPDEATIPAHIVGFTVPNNRSLAPAMLLDTEFGVIYWYECIGDIGSSVFEQAGDAYGWWDDGLITEDQAGWRGNSSIWAIETFFEMLKEHFRKLDFVPMKPYEVTDVWVEQSDYMKETRALVQNIYRKHGWPELARFDKQECAAEVKTLLDKRGAA